MLMAMLVSFSEIKCKLVENRKRVFLNSSGDFSTLLRRRANLGAAKVQLVKGFEILLRGPEADVKCSGFVPCWTGVARKTLGFLILQASVDVRHSQGGTGDAHSHQAAYNAAHPAHGAADVGAASYTPGHAQGTAGGTEGAAASPDLHPDHAGFITVAELLDAQGIAHPKGVNVFASTLAKFFEEQMVRFPPSLNEKHRDI